MPLFYEALVGGVFLHGVHHAAKALFSHNAIVQVCILVLAYVLIRTAFTAPLVAVLAVLLDLLFYTTEVVFISQGKGKHGR
jgi:hypothetical protein